MTTVVASLVFNSHVLIASVFDVRARRVPNWLVLSLLIMGIAAVAWGTAPSDSWRAASLGFATGLACWLPLWLLGMLGAGDVKLFAAASAWIGPSLSWRAALLAALLGGGIALAMLVQRRGLRKAADSVAVQAPHPRAIVGAAASAQHPQSAETVPYAVPMAIALAIAWFFPEFLRSLV
jgi:prepilin peptidase CpaA